jgi:arylesterase/paraoxonase
MPLFGSTLTIATALLALILAGAYTAVLGPLFSIWGITNRDFSVVNNKQCTVEPLLPACEKIVQVQPSGILYLACSKPSSRTHWTPAVGRLNETGASFDDYVATYDPKSRTVTKLSVRGFSSTRGLSLHGMDVVPSASDPDMLFVYLVNHRAPMRNGKAVPAKDVGADSVIEIFKTTLGGKEMTHVKTVENDIIITPNDVIGEPDGKSFYFTNDRDRKVGHVSIWITWANDALMCTHNSHLCRSENSRSSDAAAPPWASATPTQGATTPSKTCSAAMVSRAHRTALSTSPTPSGAGSASSRSRQTRLSC